MDVVQHDETTRSEVSRASRPAELPPPRLSAFIARLPLGASIRTLSSGHVLMALLAYIGLTLLRFSPLLPWLAAGLHDRSDTALNTWIIAWQAHVLPRAPLALFNAPIFHPLPNTLALSEILWPVAPLAVPLLAASGNPVLVYNLFFLAAFPLAGLGAYLLALRMTGYRLAAFLAGLIYAFSPHQFGHLSQLQLLSIAWLPLTLLFLDRFWAHGRPRDGFVFALCAAFQTLSAFYYGFQVVLAVGLYVGMQVVVSGQWLVVRRLSSIVHRPSYIIHRLISLLPWVALAGVLIAPFAAPYWRVRGELGLERSIGETLRNAATLEEWVRPPAANLLYWALPGLASAEGGLFPGVIPIGLAALGLLIRRGRWAGRGFWLLLALTAVILSLGPQLKLTAADPGGLALPFGWLYEHVPGMTAIRAPGRFANSAFLALAMLAASGACAVITQSARLRRGDGQAGSLRYITTTLLALLILAAIGYAGGLGRFAVQPMPPAAAPLYAWLAGQPAAPIIELPLTSEMAAPPANSTRASTNSAAVDTPSSAWPDYNLLRYQYFQTGHWQPTADGYSGFVPPHHRELGLTLAHFPDVRSLALLAGLGIERVIVHSEVMEAFAPGRAATLQGALAARGTSGVRLEREFGPEWVYRLPQGQAARAPVAGRFWATAGGQAFLLLAAPGGRESVIPPGMPLRVRGVWQGAEGGVHQPFEVSVRLPLLVGGGSVLPLNLPRPPVGGAYTLRLAADDTRLAAPPFSQEVVVTTAMNETELLAIQAAAPAASEIAAGQTSPLAMTFSTGQETTEIAVAAGQTVTVTLPWRLLDRPAGDCSISARILDAAGQMAAQDDRALSGGRDLVRAWQGELTITTTHTLRLPQAPGRYTFQAFFYRPDDRLDYLFLDAAGDPTAAIESPLLIGPANSGALGR
jgi:hypothetical protein